MYDVFKLEVTGDNETRMVILEFVSDEEAHRTSVANKEAICRRFVKQLTDKPFSLYYIGALISLTDRPYVLPDFSFFGVDHIYDVRVGITTFPNFNTFSYLLKADESGKQFAKIKTKVKLKGMFIPVVPGTNAKFNNKGRLIRISGKDGELYEFYNNIMKITFDDQIRWIKVSDSTLNDPQFYSDICQDRTVALHSGRMIRMYKINTGILRCYNMMGNYHYPTYEKDTRNKTERWYTYNKQHALIKIVKKESISYTSYREDIFTEYKIDSNGKAIKVKETRKDKNHSTLCTRYYENDNTIYYVDNTVAVKYYPSCLVEAILDWDSNNECWRNLKVYENTRCSDPYRFDRYFSEKNPIKIFKKYIPFVKDKKFTISKESNDDFSKYMNKPENPTQPNKKIAFDKAKVITEIFNGLSKSNECINCPNKEKCFHKLNELSEQTALNISPSVIQKSNRIECHTFHAICKRAFKKIINEVDSSSKNTKESDRFNVTTNITKRVRKEMDNHTCFKCKEKDLCMNTLKTIDTLPLKDFSPEKLHDLIDSRCPVFKKYFINVVPEEVAKSKAYITKEIAEGSLKGLNNSKKCNTSSINTDGNLELEKISDDTNKIIDDVIKDTLTSAKEALDKKILESLNNASTDNKKESSCNEDSIMKTIAKALNEYDDPELTSEGNDLMKSIIKEVFKIDPDDFQ